MARSAKPSLSGYRTVGRTTDGIIVLAPKLKSKSFTKKEISAAVRSVLGGGAKHPGAASGKGGVYVEKRAQGDYAVRRENSARASAVLPTQAEAIRRANELAPETAPKVKRVRHTSKGQPGRWRKA